MKINLLDELIPDAKELLKQRSFVQTTLRHDPEAFGNAEVVLTSLSFDLQVVRDRGQTSLAVSPPAQADWYPLDRVLRFIRPSLFHAPPRPEDPDILVSALTNQYDSIAELMKLNPLKSGLADFGRREVAVFLRHLLPASVKA